MVNIAQRFCFGKGCGVQVTPQMLQHCCATLLLNTGAPILAVQTILGHRHIDTTMGYARVWDAILAADTYPAKDVRSLKHILIHKDARSLCTRRVDLEQSVFDLIPAVRAFLSTPYFERFVATN